MVTLIGLKEKDKILINAKKSCQSTFYLRGHYLDGLPKCVSQKPLITSLKFLDLSYNSLEGFPLELGLLTNLEELYIQHNQLQHIPDEICNLVQIQRLGLAHNCVQTIPFSLSKLSRLEWLNLSGNQIHIIPHFLLCLPSLTSLRVLRNPIDNVPRDIYIQGLEAMRKFFAVVVKPLSNIANSLCDQENKEIKTERQKAYEDTIIDEAFTSDESRIDIFSTSFSEYVLNVEKSQKDEIQLVEDLKEKIRISQEIRKMNLEYLRKQEYSKNTRCITRPRRMSDISLDLTIRKRRRQLIKSTSEYGSLSTFTEYMSLPQQNRDDDDKYSENFSVCTSDDESSMCELDTEPRKRHITHGDICVIIPECNQSGHLQSEFVLDIIEDLAYQPTSCMRGRQVVGSEVLMLQPHGALFFKSDPAIISLPYDVKVESRDEIICLCSDTGFGEIPNWQAMDKQSYTVFQSHVEIRAEHFSLFAVVAQKQYHSAQCLIRKGVGGSLVVDEVPGVEIRFPGTSLLYDIQASVKVFYANEPYDVDHDDPNAFGLAAPVIELGPHGCQFDPSSPELVTVRLPLPNGKEILEAFGDRQLTFWCSSTQENEPLDWQQFHPQNMHIDSDIDSICSVYFSVEHFTFFKVLWDVIDAVLYEAKLGASHFIPAFQFYVSCEALMSDSEDGVRFGLCICCSRFGISLDGIGNFPISIGKHPPKMISTGPLVIRVISKLFEADVEAGQKELIHQEHFTGRQFVAQFVCCFTGDAVLYGSFGRVEIEQPTQDNISTPKLLFSFNLYKPRDPEQYDSSMAWDVHLSRELAALVTIRTDRDMGDEVWEDLAKSLRYTQVEINKIASSDDPMTELLANFKRRGGQPREFISAMYNIGQIKNSPHLNSSFGSGINSLSGPSEAETESKMCQCDKKNMRKRKIPHEISLEDTFLEIAGKVPKMWKELGRALKINENKLDEIEQDYKHDRVREQAYQMLLAWRESFPEYCTLSSLSEGLCKIGLKNVARQCCMVKI
ncbi:uncharacterized protein LOC116302432 [Actinia tenebrosa]|uniref:Uncharacterized protein LOC116302432 n=1 Tax=Actinia tenebrosa TaxID=6105 RepID=A0A6P8ILC7_ACTTE|nr:uncharacterized protein LOC116302432 [Actinia tenebrosa]